MSAVPASVVLYCRKHIGASAVGIYRDINRELYGVKRKINGLIAYVLFHAALVNEHNFRTELISVNDACVGIIVHSVRLTELGMDIPYEVGNGHIPVIAGCCIYNKRYRLYEHTNRIFKLRRSGTSVIDSKEHKILFSGKSVHGLGKCRLHEAVGGDSV